MNFELLKKLVSANAIAGREKEVSDLLTDDLNDYVDEITSDNLGSFISVIKNDNKPKLMLAAHMDEVGFIVKQITKEGFIKFCPVGGWYDQVLLSQKLQITTRLNKKYIGIVGCKAPHIIPKDKRSDVVKIEDMFIDLGVYSDSDVNELGICVGDMITPVGELMQMCNEDFLCAKAFDNRIGCYIVSEVMKQVNKDTINCELYGCATTQEEVGLRGAKTIAHKVKPDVCLTIDTGIAGDTPNIMPHEADAKLSQGFQIVVMDHSAISNYNLRNLIQDMSDELGLKYTMQYILAGGTDTGNIHVANDGVISISLVITTRYLHTHSTVINKKDVECLIKLVTEFVNRFNEDVLDKLIND